MGKMTWATFLKRVQKEFPKAEPDKVFNMIKTMFSKHKESYKEVLRNSWVFEVIWNVFNETATPDDGKKRTTKQIIRNWVKTRDYKEAWCMFMGEDSWFNLKSLKKIRSSIPEVRKQKAHEQHVKNVNDLWVGKNGKHLRKILEENNGLYPIKNPENSLFKTMKYKDQETKKDKRIGLMYPTLPAQNERKQEANLLKMGRMGKNKLKHPGRYPFRIGPKKKIK